MIMTLDDYNERILKPLAERYEKEVREVLEKGREKLIANIAVVISDGYLTDTSSIEIAKAVFEMIEKSE